MSIDTYFCFCCLSTNDLSCLYSNDTTTNCGNLLQTLFNVSISLEDYEYDGYICKDCAHSLISIQKFRTQVFETLNILQSNGLIQLLNENNQVTVTKIVNDALTLAEEKFSIDDPANPILLIDEKLEGTIEKSIIVKNEPEPILDDNILVSANRTEKNLTEKLEENDTENKITCGQLKKPVTQYEVPEDFKCNICEAVMPNLYTYHTHMNQHYPNHICEACGKGFLTEKRLKRHMPSHKTGPFKCQVCDAEFSNYNTLNSHRQRKHSTVELYKCPHCPQIFGNLSAHMRRAHASVRPSRAPLATYKDVKPHRCTLCPNKYPRKKALVVHMRTHNDDRRFGCEVCGKRFIQKCTLLVHAKTHNRKAPDDSNENIDAEKAEYTFVKWSDVNKN
ncbi:hypothetical protein evm_010842 [Chilo suppressalis]|nr:hypothetical protein evm_010842 [Chilo suppressalis]